MVANISSSISALPGMPIPAWLLCAPLVLGNGWLLICWAAQPDLGGFLSLPGFLCQKVVWVDLYNYWMVAIMGGVPFFISLIGYTTLVYDCEIIARDVAATIGLDSLDAHTTLVQKGRRIMPLDIFVLFLYFTSVTITLFFHMVPKRFLVFTTVSQLATGVFMGVCSFCCACILPFALRDVRVGLLRREGGSILTHLDATKVKFLLIIALSCVCFFYVAVLASSSVPFTRAMTRLDEPDGNPCVIARNATYIQTRCQLSTAIHGPRYVCDDGGWEEYSSAEVGCHAAQLYYSVVAKVYSAFGVWLNGFGWVAFSEVEHAMESKPKFPVVQLLARLLIYVTILVLGPTYLAIIIAPSDELVPNSWVVHLVHDLWAALINIGAWLGLLALFNFELIMRRFDALLSGSALSISDATGTEVDLREEISRLLQPTLNVAREQGGYDAANGEGAGRFTLEPHDLVSGHPKEAALGVNYYMKVSPRFSLPPASDAIRAVREEFEQFGTATDKECLDYVLFQRAGTSDRTFSNGNLRRDCDAQGNVLPSRLDAEGLGKRFEDFCADPRARVLGKLQPAHVLALRIYTTAAFVSLNSPLRSTSPDRPPHPFPVTINLIKEGIGQLRAVDAESDDAQAPRDLWRGLKNLRAQDNFLRGGGTELA